MSIKPESIPGPGHPESTVFLPQFQQGLSASPRVAAILKDMDAASKRSIAALDFVDRAQLLLEVSLWCESFAAFHIRQTHRGAGRA